MMPIRLKMSAVLFLVVFSGGSCRVSAEDAASGAPAAAPADAAATFQERLRTGYDRIDSRQWTEAAAALEQAIRLAPTNELARFGLATAYIKLKRYGEALPVLEGLLKEYPDNAAVRNNLAWILVKADDPALRNVEKALRYAQDALMTVPMDFNVWGTLAEVYYAMGRYDRAMRMARGALNLSRAARDPDVAEFQALYRRCRLAAGESDTEDTED